MKSGVEPASASMDSTVQFRIGMPSAEAASLLVLAAGVLLRIGLALVNTESNDPHLPVIGVIAFERRFPERLELWEAFQPKLYHTVVALLWRLTPTASPAFLNQVTQLVSCAAGIATLLVFLRFLRQVDVSARTRLLAFALVALNPQLTGISAQATNDAFVILFTSLALYWGYEYFRNARRGPFAGLLISSILAGISKGNGLVVIVAVLLTFAAALIWHNAAHPSTRRRTALHALLFLVVAGPAVWEIGPYGQHMRTYGSPFVTNWEPPPTAHLWRQTFVERPGLTSIVHGLFTFRLIDVLRNPVSTDSHTEYPVHRTSVWTRLYAQAHFVHFESFPYSWQARTETVRHLGRSLLLLALFPTVLFIRMLVVFGARALRGAWHSTAGVLPLHDALLVLAGAGYVAFVALYAVRLRDYSSMKAIFVFPGLLAFGLGLALALEDFLEWSRARPNVQRAAQALIALLLIGYATDIATLTRTLMVDPGWCVPGNPEARSLRPVPGHLQTIPPARGAPVASLIQPPFCDALQDPSQMREERGVLLTLAVPACEQWFVRCPSVAWRRESRRRDRRHNQRKTR